MRGPVPRRMRRGMPSAHAPTAGACMHAPGAGPHAAPLTYEEWFWAYWETRPA